MHTVVKRNLPAPDLGRVSRGVGGGVRAVFREARVGDARFCKDFKSGGCGSAPVAGAADMNRSRMEWRWSKEARAPVVDHPESAPWLVQLQVARSQPSPRGVCRLSFDGKMECRAVSRRLRDEGG